MSKINKRSEEYDIPVETIIDEIKKYNTAVIPFVISPSRQNFYENMAYIMIKNISGVYNLVNLPNNKLFVYGGAVISKSKLKQYPKTKTLDFKWDYNGYSIYASHKYTKDTGGAQDNQYKDLQDFIRESKDTNLSRTIFVAIADGDYYLNRNGRAGTTRIEHLKSLCTNKVVACRMENLKQKLDMLCR